MSAAPPPANSHSDLGSHKVKSPDSLKRKLSKSSSKELDEEEVRSGIPAKRLALDPRSRQCPYLDTINRSVLDFDFEKLCSVSLSHINCYACLVCGKYFQGRGQKSHAYTHSVQEGHHVFLNLETHKFYCLPDNYEVVDSSLDDVIYVLNPVFTPAMIKQLNLSSKQCIAYDGKSYLAGIVGLNNIKANDYCNVIMHTLSHIAPIRDYFLREENYKGIKAAPGDRMIMVPHRFGELLRKLWNPRNFKTHVSPHEMLQAVVLCSKKRFQITKQGDPIDFMSWLLNALHLSLGGTRKLSSSIINKTFRGKMTVYSRMIPTSEVTESERLALEQSGAYEEKVEENQFLYLTCDLPPMPLYPDELKENIIPQVPLASILSKFNGVTEKEYKTYKDSTLKRFEITKLPPYIIVFIKRFTKNQFVYEKNHTIVNFPIKNVDFGELLSEEAKKSHKYTHYNLLSNIVHDGEPKSGVYLAHILHKGSGKWFELQDLHVMDRLPQMIPLSESYIQVYELNKSIPNKSYVPPTKAAGNGASATEEAMSVAAEEAGPAAAEIGPVAAEEIGPVAAEIGPVAAAAETA